MTSRVTPTSSRRRTEAMFTGIVEELGTVAALTDLGDAMRLTVTGPTVVEDAALGDSIAVNGCCLTVAERVEGGFTADVMRATLAATGLGGLREGSRVNLERAVTPATRLGGHVVQGHVDATGTVRSRDAQRALGPRRDRPARRPRPLRRGEGLHHRRRGQPHRRRARRRRGHLHRLAHPRDPGAHHAGRRRPRHRGQPRGRRDGEVRRAPARPRRDPTHPGRHPTDGPGHPTSTTPEHHPEGQS